MRGLDIDLSPVRGVIHSTGTRQMPRLPTSYLLEYRLAFRCGPTPALCMGKGADRDWQGGESVAGDQDAHGTAYP